MTSGPVNRFFTEQSPDSIRGVVRACHEAMATVFELYIFHEDDEYAKQASHAAFQEVDRLEGLLSRFIENSDISRINRSGDMEEIQVSEETLECLRRCEELRRDTGGAFDVTVGGLVGERIVLEQQRFIVKAGKGVTIDLGGVAKGYALDKVRGLLEEWGIERALLNAGFSTVLAMETPVGLAGWPVRITEPANSTVTLSRLELRRNCLSGSGLQRGKHIIDPHSGRPVEDKVAAWALAPDGTAADALSTAFMVMGAGQIEAFCARFENVAAMVLPARSGPEGQGEEVMRFGQWPQDELSG